MKQNKEFEAWLDGMMKDMTEYDALEYAKEYDYFE